MCMWKSSYTYQAQLRIFTLCSSPALPMDILGPTLERLLPQQKIMWRVLLSFAPTLLLVVMQRIFTGTLYQDNFSFKEQKLGSKLA